MAIYIKLTCKEKIELELKEVTPETKNVKGIVKWYVEILDDTDEITGVATIQTMVWKRK